MFVVLHIYCHTSFLLPQLTNFDFPIPITDNRFHNKIKTDFTFFLHWGFPKSVKLSCLPRNLWRPRVKKDVICGSVFKIINCVLIIQTRSVKCNVFSSSTSSPPSMKGENNLLKASPVFRSSRLFITPQMSKTIYSVIVEA